MKGVKNKGFLSIEAALVLPLFMLFIYSFTMFCKVIILRAVIYEAAVVEVAEYMSEYAYLSENIEALDYTDYFVATSKIDEYLDDKELVNRFVRGGTSGILLLGSRFPDESGYVTVRVRYTVNFYVPFLGSFKKTYTDKIKQKAYLGYNGPGEVTDESGIYVYIAENGVVYHHSRRCTYLYHETMAVTKAKAEKRRYDPCSYCDASRGGLLVYITSEGDKYHSSPLCSRLLRNVRRVRLKDVSGMPECEKCR